MKQILFVLQTSLDEEAASLCGYVPDPDEPDAIPAPLARIDLITVIKVDFGNGAIRLPVDFQLVDIRRSETVDEADMIGFLDLSLLAAYMEPGTTSYTFDSTGPVLFYRALKAGVDVSMLWGESQPGASSARPSPPGYSQGCHVIRALDWTIALAAMEPGSVIMFSDDASNILSRRAARHGLDLLWVGGNVENWEPASDPNNAPCRTSGEPMPSVRDQCTALNIPYATAITALDLDDPDIVIKVGEINVCAAALLGLTRTRPDAPKTVLRL